MDGTYTFLTSVQDNDAAKDKANRQRWALQENNRYVATRIAYLAIGGMQVAWVHPKKHVQFVTYANPLGLAQYPYQWTHDPSHIAPTVYSPSSFPYNSTLAATNGVFFATGNHPAGTRIWYPLAEIGPSWKHYQDVFRWRWSFGMSLTGGDFICERMVRKPNHGFVVSRNVKAKQCGMSDAGLLVTTDIDPATGLNVTPHAPQEVPEAINDVWPSSTAVGDELDRTAIAWSTNGDFFLICGRVAGATTPSTYNDMANFIINTLPNDPNVLPFHVSIKTGMMVDGGGASTLSYLKTGNNPAHGELLPTGAARATSHLCTMIGVYTP